MCLNRFHVRERRTDINSRWPGPLPRRTGRALGILAGQAAVFQFADGVAGLLPFPGQFHLWLYRHSFAVSVAEVHLFKFAGRSTRHSGAVGRVGVALRETTGADTSGEGVLVAGGGPGDRGPGAPRGGLPGPADAHFRWRLFHRVVWLDRPGMGPAMAEGDVLSFLPFRVLRPGGDDVGADHGSIAAGGHLDHRESGSRSGHRRGSKGEPDLGTDRPV